MRQIRRCFGVKILPGGKLELIGFLSENERTEYCEAKENHTRKITISEWKKIPADMKK